MPKFSLELKKDSTLHKKLAKKLEARIQLALRGHQLQHAKWQKAEETTLAYVPETDADAMRKSKRDQGAPTYTTIQIPYSYAILMSAHTYWTSVFFARSPIHQFSGRHGEGEMQVQAMEALIDYQQSVGQFLVPYYVWLYDAGKYGCGILGNYWCREKLHYGQLVEMENPMSGKTEMYQVMKEVPGYLGNRVYNVSPWDFMHDPRVALKNFQQGEFVICRKRLGWNQILRRRDEGYFNSNVDVLKDHVAESTRAQDGSDQLQRPLIEYRMTDDEDEKITHPAGAEFFEVYIELVPKEWGVGNTSFPTKWCFTITTDYGLIVGASPLGYIHCQFPFDVLEHEVEGYGLYARSMPEIMDSVQNTIDWLINTHFFNVRQSLNNQFIVDPSKLVIKDVQNSGPGFVWRVRPEAYGSDLTKIFMQVPVTDVTRGNINDVQMMLGVGERTLGVNDQIMGSLNSGGRKTATEVRTTTGFGVNRLKTNSEYMSGMGMAPHAQKLVQTSQQYYDMKAKLRRVGSFGMEAGAGFLDVTPDAIAGFFDLVPVDGALPIDRMAQANLWKEIMAGTRYLPPQVLQEYNWGRIFAWTAMLGGLKNINQFKVQVLPDQLLQNQTQQGNVIPMPTARGLPGPGRAVEPGNSASTAAGLNALEGGSPDGPAF